VLFVILGKVGGRAPEDVILELIRSKCLPALLYGLEVCPLRKSDISSLDFVVNRFFMKLFHTNNIDIVNYCTLLLSNVVRSLLQNIDHVKMFYVNLRNLFHCCYFLFFFVCLFLLYCLFSSFYHIMMNKICTGAMPIRRYFYKRLQDHL